ncbi:MAG TPA: haloacid dehalogenase-like hydrolase [Terriglobales bacterium]|nr:haloacid dehalogenase-like hydrolase [Terriglobales bacterium]
MTLAPATVTAFLDSVLALHPQIAAFDCDGTLWSGDAGEGFFSWELNQGLVSDQIARWARPRYAEYRAGNVPEEVMCGEMVTMHRGLREAEVQAAAARYFDGLFVKNIFPEMRELVKRLQEQGCDVWAVSSTNEWVIRAGMRHFGIAEQRIIAAAGEIADGVITDCLLRVPSGPGKPQAIQELIGRQPDIAFGNSIWDADMLRMAAHAFAINANPDLKAIAEQNAWRIYQPNANSA